MKSRPYSNSEQSKRVNMSTHAISPSHRRYARVSLVPWHPVPYMCTEPICKMLKYFQLKKKYAAVIVLRLVPHCCCSSSPNVQTIVKSYPCVSTAHQHRHGSQRPCSTVVGHTANERSWTTGSNGGDNGSCSPYHWYVDMYCWCAVITSLRT